MPYQVEKTVDSQGTFHPVWVFECKREAVRFVSEQVRKGWELIYRIVEV